MAAEAPAESPPISSEARVVLDVDEGEYATIKEAPALEALVNEEKARVGRAAINRGSTKNSTRRKSTIRQANAGGGGLGSKRRSGSESKGKKTTPRPQPGVKRYFSEHAGVKEIIAALMLPDDGEDEDGLLRCLLALENCMESDPKNAELLGYDQEGLKLINTMITRYNGTDNMVATGLWTLSNVAVTEELASAVCQVGGDGSAIEVLASHRASEMVVHAAIALVCNVALHESLRQQLVDKTALQRAMTVLGAYPNHEWIQYTTIQTLQNFANTAEFCGVMLQENAAKHIIKAMKAFYDHEELLQSANWIFSCLLYSSTDDQRRQLQAEHKLAAVVSQSLKDSPSHLGVLFTGLSALSNLGRTDDIVPALAQTGIVDICAMCMRTHIGHEGLQMVSCRCLVIVASDEQSKSEFKRGDVSALCDRVIEHYPDSNAAVEAAEAIRLFGSKSCCVIL